MDSGGINQSGIASAVWTNPTRALVTDPATDAGAATLVWAHAARTVTVDPATDAGAATLVWGHATRALTIGGGAVIGSTLQAPTIVTGISMTAIASTTVVTFSGSGVLMRVGVGVSTTSTGTPITATIDITVDGGTVMHIPIYTASAAAWDPGALTLSTYNIGTGASVGNMMNFDIYVQFNTSILVKYNVTATSLSGGAAIGSAFWAHN